VPTTCFPDPPQLVIAIIATATARSALFIIILLSRPESLRISATD
jgi:hypothetical protein